MDKTDARKSASNYPRIKKIFPDAPVFALCWFLLLAAWPVLAQLNKKITYPEFYCYSTGDDTSRANPDYDDSNWERIKNGSIPDRKGITWFRFIFEPCRE